MKSSLCLLDLPSLDVRARDAATLPSRASDHPPLVATIDTRR